MLARALGIARGPARVLGLWEPAGAGALAALTSASPLCLLNPSGVRSMAAAAKAAPAKKAPASGRPSTAPAGAAEGEEDDEGVKKKKKIAVTVPSKDAAPAGAAWRRNPADRASGEWMKDENAAEAYANLMSLANYRFPPKPSALERVCIRASSAEDLALVMKGLNMCVSRGTPLTERFSVYFADACCRCGDPEAALAKFRDPARSRLFMGPGALQKLVAHAMNTKDGALLRKTLGLVKAKGWSSLLNSFDNSWPVAAAQARVGDATAAVRGYGALMSAFPKRWLHKALSRAVLEAVAEAPLAGDAAGSAEAPAAAAEGGDKAAEGAKKASPAGPTPLGDAELTIVAQTLLPNARKLHGPEFAELIAKIEAKYPQLASIPPAPAPPAAAPAADASAAPAPSA